MRRKSEELSTNALLDCGPFLIKGVLNNDKYNDISADELRAFICREANSLLEKHVSPDMTERVQARCKYSVIDSSYQLCSTIQVTLQWDRNVGSKILSFRRIQTNN